MKNKLIYLILLFTVVQSYAQTDLEIEVEKPSYKKWKKFKSLNLRINLTNNTDEDIYILDPDSHINLFIGHDVFYLKMETLPKSDLGSLRFENTLILIDKQVSCECIKIRSKSTKKISYKLYNNLNLHKINSSDLIVRFVYGTRTPKNSTRRISIEDKNIKKCAAKVHHEYVNSNSIKVKIKD